MRGVFPKDLSQQTVLTFINSPVSVSCRDVISLRSLSCSPIFLSVYIYIYIYIYFFFFFFFFFLFEKDPLRVV